MEIINNKYRIIETEFSNRVYSSHIIKDILFPKNEESRMFIIDPTMIPSLTMKKIISEFQDYSSIKHPFVVQGKHVDMVYSIDRKPVERNNYYFIVEKFDYALSFFEFCKSEASSDAILNKYVDLLKIFELLSRKGFNYEFNSKENIYIDNEKNIKIKDILISQIDYFDNNKSKSADAIYKSPELYSGKYSTTYSSIYSLGIILKQITDNDDFDEKCARNLKAIIEKMTAYKASDRYSSANQIIEDINFFCNKDYEFLFENKSFYIDKTPSVLVRDSIHNNIFKGLSRLKSGDSDILLYEIKGERDTGKTKTLRSIRKELSVNGVNIFASFDEDRPILKQNSMVPIVSKILGEKGYDLVEKYEKVKEFLKTGTCKKDDYTCYSQINAFIKMAVDTQITAIIIDGLKESDRDAIEIIKYMIYDKKIKEKIMIIYSTEDEIQLEKTEKFTLNNLTIDETTQLIKSILCIDYDPIEIATTIYKDTIGNVRHVKNILFDLIEQSILELDDSGNWIFKSDKYDDLRMSGESLENPRKHLDNLNAIQQEAVLNLSLFKNPSTAEEISCMYSSDVKFIDIVDNLTDLVNEKIMITQFNDDGYYYEFEDRTFKKQVYDSMPENLKVINHKKVSDNILNMKFYLRGRRLDELIYHLKKSRQFKDASYYTIKRAQEYYKSGSKAEAFEMDKEAIEYSLLSEDKLRQIIAYQKAGNRCFINGQITKTEEYYKKSVEISSDLKNYNLTLLLMNRLLDVHMNLNDIDAIKKDFAKIEEYLEIYSSKKALLDYHVSMLRYLVKIDDFQEAKIWLEKAEKLSNNKYKKQHAWIMFYKGKILHELGYPIDKLLHLHEEILENFMKIGDKLGIACTYNSFGFIYSEYLLDNKKSREYDRLMRDYSEEHNMLPQISVANFNLGESVLRELDYEEAIEFFKRSIEISIQLKKRDLVYYGYVYLAYIMVEILDFSSAVIYLKKAEHLMDENIKYERAILLFHEVKMSLNMFVGEPKLKTIHGNFLKESGVNMIGFQDNTIKSLELFGKAKETKSSEAIDKLLRDSFKLAKELVEYPYVLKRFLDISLLSKYFKRYDLIDEIYTWVINNVKTEENTRARNYFDYMKYYLNGTHKRKKEIENLATKLNSEYDECLLFHINLILSEDYILSKEYYLGVSYLVENYITFKNKIFSFNSELNLDNFFGSIIYDLITRITTIEDFSLENIITADIYYPDREAINEILNENTLLKSLLKNKVFIQEARKYLNWDFEELSTDDIMENLKYSNVGNMEILLKQIMATTWAQSGGIFLHQEIELNCIVNINNLRDTKELERIFNQVDLTQNRLIVSEFGEKNKLYSSLLPNGARGFICIPIFTDTLQMNERRLNRRKILGYAYIESKMVLNSFTDESYSEVIKYVNLLSAFIDNFNLSLKYSIDKLTQAYNRQYFDLYIKNEMENAQGQKSMFSLVIMDIDLFKSVNDRFGHRFGDKVLKKFSKIIQNSIRGGDFFARYGGEEFVLIIKSANQNEAFKIADRIRETINNELKDLDGKSITVSMGISSYPEHGIWEEELINKADIALYKAKDSGRNKVCIWNNTYNNSEIFDRKKENINASIFGENHQRANLFVDSINLIRENTGRNGGFDKYIKDVLKYFEAEKLFIVKFKDGQIESAIKGTEGNTMLLHDDFENQFNLNLVKTCFHEDKSFYMTDWEQVSKLDELTGMPEWDSILCTPIIYKGEKKGVLCLNASVRLKEFTLIDSSVAQIIAPIIGNFI